MSSSLQPDPTHPFESTDIIKSNPEPSSITSSVVNFPDGDVLLRTTTTPATTFQLPSWLLKSTSGFFRDVLSLPQSKGSTGKPFSGPSSTARTLTELPISEPAPLVERLLSMICGLPIPEWESFDMLVDTLYLAERWDTPGPLSYMRPILMALPLVEQDPLRVYQIACHFGWKKEAQVASTKTLPLELYNEDLQEKLQSLTTRDLLPLLQLHRRRRDAFKEQLDDPLLFNAGNGVGCSRQGCDGKIPEGGAFLARLLKMTYLTVGVLDNHTWRELKARMYVEIDRRPLGDTVVGVVEMEQWPEAKACWSARCPICNKPNYDKPDTLRNLKACIDRLPLTT